MRLDARLQPEIAAGKVDTRYQVGGVWFLKRGGRWFTCATNGRMLLLCPVDSEDGDQLNAGKVYPPAAFKAARKAAGKLSEAVIVCNGVARVVTKEGTTEFQPLEDGRVPDVEGVIPTGPAIGKAVFNAEQLVALQRGMGADAIEIEYHGDDTPAIVRPAFGGVDGCIGVVMPWSGT